MQLLFSFAGKNIVYAGNYIHLFHKRVVFITVGKSVRSYAFIYWLNASVEATFKSIKRSQALNAHQFFAPLHEKMALTDLMICEYEYLHQSQMSHAWPMSQ